MLKFQNTAIKINDLAYIPAFKATVSQGAALTARKVLAPTMFDGYGILGPPEYQLSVDFPMIIASGWTTGNGYGYIYSYLTGDTSFTVTVGATTYNTCFLESLGLNIQPNAPIMCSASIRMFDDGSIAEPATGAPFTIASLHSKIAYGHNVSIVDLATRAEHIAAISHTIACSRSYSTQIWGTPNISTQRNLGFLDAMELKTSIQHRGVNDKIPYTGYGGGLTLTMTGAAGYALNLDMISNARITNIDHNHEAGKNGMASTSITQVVY